MRLLNFISWYLKKKIFIGDPDSATTAQTITSQNGHCCQNLQTLFPNGVVVLPLKTNFIYWKENWREVWRFSEQKALRPTIILVGWALVMLWLFTFGCLLRLKYCFWNYPKTPVLIYIEVSFHSCFWPFFSVNLFFDKNNVLWIMKKVKQSFTSWTFGFSFYCFVF